MDDLSGTLYAFTEKSFSGAYIVNAIDTESGKVKFSVELDCEDDFSCGTPLLTKDGTLVYFAYERKSGLSQLQTIRPDGTTGSWSFGVSDDVIESVISSDDVYCYCGFESVSCVQYGQSTELFVLNKTGHQIGELASSGESLFFTEEWSPSSIWEVDTLTGKVIQQKVIRDATEEEIETHVSIDPTTNLLYFVDNWDVNGPALKAYSLKEGMKKQWNQSFTFQDQASCAPPVITSSSLLLDCGEQTRIGGNLYTFLLNPQTGDVLHTENGCYGIALLSDTLYAIQCQDGLYGMNVQTGEKKMLFNDVLSLQPGYTLTDSSGCLFFCQGVYNQKPVYCQKRCT